MQKGDNSMDAQLREKLASAGIDVYDLTERLMGNMTLISRFMSRFPDDKNYGALVDSLEKGQYEEAFRAAHTLKGVCANLSMTELSKVVGEQTEYLRAGNIGEAQKLMPQISREYNAMVELIRSIQW